jgi:hypothetical protein
MSVKISEKNEWRRKLVDDVGKLLSSVSKPRWDVYGAY